MDFFKKKTSGYVYISINPSNTYIYKFTKNQDKIMIQSISNYEYYYIIAQKMYICNDENNEYTLINEISYSITNFKEILLLYS